MIVTGILCDMDGTLVDSLPGIQFSGEEALRAVLPGRALPDLGPYIGPPIREVFRRALDDLPSSSLDELVLCFRKSYDGEGCLKGTVYEGVRDTLSALKERRIRLFVVTNKPIDATRRILRHGGLVEYFEGVYSPDVRNPSFQSKGEMAASLMREFRLAPEGTVLVGDSAEDRKAARECGLRFAAAAYGYGGIHLDLDRSREDVLQSFSDLRDVVKGRGPGTGEPFTRRTGEEENAAKSGIRKNPERGGRKP